MLYLEKASRKAAEALFIVLILTSLFISCSDADMASASVYNAPAGEPELMKQYGEAVPSMRSMPEEAADMVFEAGAEKLFSAAAQNAPGQDAAYSTSPASRKKRLSAGCTIETAEPALETVLIKSVAEKHGGWVESSSENHITVRVPADNFRAAYDEILSAGNVIDRYEQAEDVTDYFYDMETRLSVLETTRGRLETLLAAEKDMDKKVRILREMKRIDDSIERLKAEIETLSMAVAYSVITVDFVPFNHVTAEDLSGFFPWIENLDPFESTVRDIYRKIRIVLPDSFAVVKSRDIRYFHAEAADGTVLRIGTIKNRPRGSGSFWQKALAHGLEMKFSSFEEGEAGQVKYVIFKSKGNEPYSYLAGTALKRELIYVIEALFPDDESRDRWLDEITGSIGGLEIK